MPYVTDHVEAEKRATAKEVSHVEDDVFPPELFRFIRDQFVNVHIRQPVQPHDIYIRAQSKYIEPNPKQPRTQTKREKGAVQELQPLTMMSHFVTRLFHGHCNSYDLSFNYHL